jgi:hypothetical protein
MSMYGSFFTLIEDNNERYGADMETTPSVVTRDSFEREPGWIDFGTL